MKQKCYRTELKRMSDGSPTKNRQMFEKSPMKIGWMFNESWTDVDYFD
jgi:hypothetical protein